MGWITEDGKHEGWVGELFADGSVGGTTSAQGIQIGFGPDGVRIPYSDRAEWRPRSEVIGWVLMCECGGGWEPKSVRLGRPWTRVRDQADEDRAARRAFSEDGYEPGWLDDAAHAEWKEHIAGPEALAEVAELARQHARIGEELARAVGKARAAGASWADVGQAAGISRQTAHERWRRMESPAAVAATSDRSAS